MSTFHIQTKDSTRVAELDWLRVLVFGLLILYHIGMLYTEGWGWHYKSHYSSEFLANIMLWSNQWRMSLLFFISGAALSFLLAKYPGWSFIRHRVPLLLLPLIFGMLVIVVPQVYVEANSKQIIDCPNFWHFWYIYLDHDSTEYTSHQTLGNTHLEWNHLWFLPYILAYSLIFWCLNPLLNKPVIQNCFSRIANHLSLKLLVILPIFGFYLISAFLYKDHPVTHNFVDDWCNQARSFFAFLLGFVFIKIRHLWPEFKNIRWPLLISAIITYSYCLFNFHGGSLGDSFWLKEINGLIWSANLWLWLLTVIGWAQHFFKTTNPTLQYLNRGVFCFYVLHQTLIIVIAYFLVPLDVGVFWEPVLIILSVSISCLLLYEIIRRLPFIRILFGVQK